jgi:hypothetical protein
MSRDIKAVALLVFPTHSSIINDVKLSAIKKLEENNMIINRIVVEKYFLSIYLNKSIQAANILSTCLGIKKIEIASTSPNNIKSIVDKITNLGQKIIIHENFFIKVYSENSNFVSRDIEFIATGLLVEKLSNRLSRPSRNEESASKVIRVYIGNSISYISWKTLDGIQGNSYGHIKKKAFIIIYNQISFFSLIKIIQMGFIPDILILYLDYIDLKNKLISLHQILSAIPTHKLTLKLLELNSLIPKRDDINTDLWLNLLVIDICSYFSALIDVVIPFNLILHPIWLIDYSISLCIKNGKIPWMPNLFEDDLKFSTLHQNFNNIKVQSDNLKELNDLNLKDYIKVRNKTRIKSDNFEKNIKVFSIKRGSLNIRPNYIDDILNSI